MINKVGRGIACEVVNKAQHRKERKTHMILHENSELEKKHREREELYYNFQITRIICIKKMSPEVVYKS